MAEICRLCGKHKCFIDMVMEIQDEFMETESTCNNIIQHYCHVQLDSNKLLPQSICDECIGTIQHFVSFCKVVEEVQLNLQKENELKSGKTSNSSPDENFFEINQFELDSELDEQLEDRNSTKQSKKLPSKRRREVSKPDTAEEIFESELNGTSQFPILKYTIPQSEVLENGEITENGQKLFSPLRWNTILNKCETPNCNKSGFDSLLGLQYHHEINHDSKEVVVPCPLCTKASFKTIYGFINHISIKHLLDHLKFCCLVCSTMFNDLLSLLKHTKATHSNCRNIAQCLICGHHSIKMLDLRQHRLCHKVENESYMDIFESELNINMNDSKYNLKLRKCFKNPNGTVTDDRQSHFKKWEDFNFTCKLCPASEKSFNFMDYYLHCSTEHADNKDPKFYCSDCPNKVVAIFSHMPSLVTHQITLHNKELSYCCIVCSKMFWNYVALDSHYKEFHQCYKAFFCLICGRHFAHRSAKGKLVNHAITEHKLEKTEHHMIEQLDVKEVKLIEEVLIKIEGEEVASHGELKMKTKRTRQRSQQTLFGDELDTVEKLFHSEIIGTSVFPGKLHLNVSECDVTSNGELTQQMDVMKWKDLLFCAKCKINCDSIVKFKEHIAAKHSSRFHAFVCGDCDDCTFHNEISWINHIVSKHQDHLKLCCLICSQMLYNFHSLLSHYNTKHKDNYKIYPCLICGIYSKTLDDLKQHKASHVNVEKTANMITTEEHYKSFSTKMDASLFCSAVPEKERMLDGSVSKVFQSKMNVNWDYFTLECSECSFVGNTLYELIKHGRNKHPVVRHVLPKSNFKCLLCKDKDYNNIITMISHGMHKHNTCYLTYTCVVCTKMFWNFVSIHDHYRDCHSTFRVAVCLYCGRIFESITSLAVHLRGHKLTIDATNDYKCDTCSVNFDSVQLFKQHQCKVKAVQINNTSQICPTCGKSFMSRGTLSAHIKIHTAPEEPKTCEICLKVYANKYKLKQHSVTHNLHVRPFICDVCGMSFKMKNLLKRHTMVHTGERPYPCTSCEKRFAAQYDLRVHARLHTGDFPYECAHCDARYPAWSNLYKHSKSKHNLDIRSAGYKQLIASRTQATDNN